jgi:5-methylcytosine-specific restriction endonuclease McrA
MDPFDGIRAPTIEDNWRGIVLYGRNVQSYKFALAKSLLELEPAEGDLILLEELAPVYAKHLTDHLKLADKQGTSGSSKFLDACRGFNLGTVSQAELVDAAVSKGFANVIDAFHRVHHKDVPARFFLDERKTNGGIRVTNNFSILAEQPQFADLSREAEARWRLVETAWELKVSRALVAVDHDPDTELLFTVDNKRRRKNVTSSRDALNGYQLGYCFYCFDNIHLDRGNESFPEVDHFFPHSLKQQGFGPSIDGVWNLVLACKECNRGEGGKFASVPTDKLLRRLWTRNEFLIGSNHPLKETLVRQTGNQREERWSFLRDFCSRAWASLLHRWEPKEKAEPKF